MGQTVEYLCGFVTNEFRPGAIDTMIFANTSFLSYGLLVVSQSFLLHNFWHRRSTD